MKATKQIRGSGLSVALVLLMTAVLVDAADIGNSNANWYNLKQLAPGDDIRIVLNDAKAYEAKFQSVSADAIVVRQRSGEHTFNRERVLRVSAKGQSHRLRNAALGTALGAGLGFAASGNLGEEVAVFEPTHGSAPKYAALDPPIVNPVAMILAAAMPLDHVGEGAKSQRVWEAVAKVVREGKVRTYDMMRLSGGPRVIQQGAASTRQMADAILAGLE